MSSRPLLPFHPSPRRALGAALLLCTVPPPALAQVVPFSGLPHTAQGGAQVAITPAGLLVSNIGSSGQDGVAIDLGLAESLTVFYDLPPIPGGSLAVTSDLHVPGQPALGHMTATWSSLHSPGMTLSHDFPVANLRVYNGGVLVLEEFGIAPGPACSVDASAQLAAIKTCWHKKTCGHKCRSESTLRTAGPITTNTGIVVIGDQIHVEDTGPPVPDGGGIQAVRVLASGLPSFTLTGEELTYGGHPTTVAGVAQVVPNDARLEISNIGSSGQDGVCIRDFLPISGGTFAMVEWDDPCCPIPPPPGSELRVLARGTLQGVPNALLGSIRVVEGPGGVKNVEVDHTPTGTARLGLYVYYNGQQIICITILASSLQAASVGAWPTACKYDGGWLPSANPGFGLCWPNALPITIPGVGPVMGNELRVLAADSPPLAGLAEIDVLGVSLPLIVLTNVRDTPPETCIGSNYCTANPNSTGLITRICARGTAYIANNDLVLHALDMPNNAFGFFLVSAGQIFVPHPGGSAGNLCVGPSIGRGPGGIFNSGSVGTGSRPVNLNALPQPTGPVVVQPGQTWYFQCWHRDSVGGAATSNFSDGVSLLFN